MEIKPIAQFEVIEITGFRREVCNVKPVRQLEADYKEAIDGLKQIGSLIIEGYINTTQKTPMKPMHLLVQIQSIIEKAHVEKWDKHLQKVAKKYGFK